MRKRTARLDHLPQRHVQRLSIDRLQIRSHLLALLPGDIVQTAPHQMHNAQLHLRLREHRFNRLREALQPIHAGKAAGRNSGNSRNPQNGTTPKTLKGDFGCCEAIEIAAVLIAFLTCFSG